MTADRVGVVFVGFLTGLGAVVAIRFVASLVGPLAAAWRRGWASGRARAARRSGDPGNAGAAPAELPDGSDLAAGFEMVALVLPSGDKVFARVYAGASAASLFGSDGTGIRLERTNEAVPFADGLAVVFREKS
jgi:hypothetical protein